MGTITAGSIIDRAKLAVIDETNVRWTDAEWLQHLSDGQREAVIIKPSINSVNEVVPWIAGTKQTIPAGGMTFLRAVRNMGASGSTPGRAVRPVDQATLDLTRPDWHMEAAAASAKHWMFDNRDPKHYYITPPSTGGVQGEIVYAKTPAEIATMVQTIELDDSYQTYLLYYIIGRALMKDTPKGGDPSKGLAYLQSARSLIDDRMRGAERMHPDQIEKRIEK